MSNGADIPEDNGTSPSQEHLVKVMKGTVPVNFAKSATTIPHDLADGHASQHWLVKNRH
jgi:hypothetical protein